MDEINWVDEKKKIKMQVHAIAELLRDYPGDKVYYSTISTIPLDGDVMVAHPQESGTAYTAYYRLYHRVRHSPDGFAWGYNGSGPAELARCILLDFLKSDNGKLADQHYQDFKREFVATWPQNGHWMLSGGEIRKWLKARGVKAEEERGRDNE